MHIISRIFHNKVPILLKEPEETSKNTWNEMIKCREDMKSRKLAVKHEKTRDKDE
jgi:hypothetical protein